MSRLADLGHDLQTGAKTVDIVNRRKTWFLVSVALVLVSMLGLGVRQLRPLRMRLEFQDFGPQNAIEPEIPLRAIVEIQSLNARVVSGHHHGLNANPALRFDVTLLKRHEGERLSFEPSALYRSTHRLLGGQCGHSDERELLQAL